MKIQAIQKIWSVMILAAGAVLFMVWQADAQSRGRFTEEFRQTYALNRDGRVSLENINGDVRITAWDRAEVRIEAIKTAYSEEWLEEVEIVISDSPNAIRIRTRYPSRENWRGGWSDRNEPSARVDYALTVPHTARLDELELINGSVDIEGVSGEVRASSINGRVNAHQLMGETDLSTVNGDLEASWNDIAASARIDVSSVNGRVRMTIPSDTNARLTASTVHGQIRNDFDLPVNRGRYAGRNMDGRLGAGEARIELDNVNGSIDIRRANDGRALGPVENLLRERRNDRWDDDDWRDEAWGSDSDDWFEARWQSRQIERNVREAIDGIQDFVNDIVNDAVWDFDGTTFGEDIRRDVRRSDAGRIRREVQRDMRRDIRETRREMRETRHEIQQHIRHDMREAKREIQRAMRDVEREINRSVKRFEFER